MGRSDHARCPPAFGDRVEALLSSVGSTREGLEHSVGLATGLVREVAGLAGELYAPRFALHTSTTADGA
jgi:hypothetical protein